MNRKNWRSEKYWNLEKVPTLTLTEAQAKAWNVKKGEKLLIENTGNKATDRVYLISEITS